MSSAPRRSSSREDHSFTRLLDRVARDLAMPPELCGALRAILKLRARSGRTLLTPAEKALRASLGALFGKVRNEDRRAFVIAIRVLTGV